MSGGLDLKAPEVASESYLGGEIEKHMKAGSLVPDEIVLALLKKAMVKHQDHSQSSILPTWLGRGRQCTGGIRRQVRGAIGFAHEGSRPSKEELLSDSGLGG